MSAWPTIPFRETGKWLSGGTPTRDEPSYWGGDVPWIGTKDLKGFDLIGSSEFITNLGAAAGSRVVEPGAVLFVTRGMSLAKEFRVAVAATRLAFNQDVKAIVPRADLDGRFLAWFLRSKEEYVLDQCDTATHGTKRLPLERIDGMPVPLPPLTEQRRIAAILDEVDGLRRKRREALRLLDDLLRSAFLEMFGDPMSNPRGWECTNLGSVCEFVGGGTPSRAVPTYFEGDICWATSKDMGVEELLDTQEHITDSAVRESATKLVQPGAVLVVVKSKVLAHRLPVAVARTPVCFGQDLKALVPSAGWPSAYLAAHLRVGQSALLNVARGANTEGLTLEHLREYRLMVPPEVGRRKFAALDERIRGEVGVQAAAQAGVEQMFESLLHGAFAGEL